MEEELANLTNALEKIKLNMIRVNDMINHVNGWRTQGFNVETEPLEKQNQEYQEFIVNIEQKFRELVNEAVEKGNELKA
jgi:predicted ATP-grasp superfamily ATP-dependent carboligase